MGVMRSSLLTLAGSLFLGSIYGSVDAGEAPHAAGILDPRVREYLLPTRVVWQSPSDHCVVDKAQELLETFSGQVTLDNRAACVLRHEGKEPGILLDFGRELHGGLQIAVADLSPSSKRSKTTRVRVRFGESVGEAMSELGGEANATNDHAVRDETVALPSSIWLANRVKKIEGVDKIDRPAETNYNPFASFLKGD